MDKKELVKQYFLSGCNCSQSIFAAFAPDYGVEEQTALRLSIGLGGGVGRLREVCGAVSGAAMVLSLHYAQGKADGSEKAQVYEVIQSFAAEFKKEYPSVVCRDLLSGQAGSGSVPAPRDSGFYDSRPCMRILETTAELLEKALSTKEE